jgi:hypothetical protein
MEQNYFLNLTANYLYEMHVAASSQLFYMLQGQSNTNSFNGPPVNRETTEGNGISNLVHVNVHQGNRRVRVQSGYKVIVVGKSFEICLKYA